MFSPETLASSLIQARLRAAYEAGDNRTIQLITLIGITHIQTSIEQHPLGGFFSQQLQSLDSLTNQFAATLALGENDPTFKDGGLFETLCNECEEDRQRFAAMREKSASSSNPSMEH